MKAPKTKEEAEQYVGQYFIMHKAPARNDEIFFSAYPGLKRLVGQELRCLVIKYYYNYNYDLKLPGIRVIDNEGFMWNLQWDWIEPYEVKKVFKDVEDLLHHWE